MIAREPDLARLLELPLGPADTHPLDLEPFRRQVQYALILEETLTRMEGWWLEWDRDREIFHVLKEQRSILQALLERWQRVFETRPTLEVYEW